MTRIGPDRLSEAPDKGTGEGNISELERCQISLPLSLQWGTRPLISVEAVRLPMLQYIFQMEEGSVHDNDHKDDGNVT